MKKLILLLVTASIMVTFPMQPGHAKKEGKFYLNRSITKTELIKKADRPKDKIWVVDIWASWCVPCNSAVPELQKLYKEFKGRDVEFISVSYDVNRKQWVRAVKNHRMPWPQVINYNPPFEEDQFKWMFPHSSIPSIYLIDKNGSIDQMRGMRDLKYNLKALTASE